MTEPFEHNMQNRFLSRYGVETWWEFFDPRIFIRRILQLEGPKTRAARREDVYDIYRQLRQLEYRIEYLEHNAAPPTPTGDSQK